MKNLSIELWRIEENSQVFVKDFDTLVQATEHLLKVQGGFEAIEEGCTRMEDEMNMTLNVNSDIFVGQYKIQFWNRNH